MGRVRVLPRERIAKRVARAEAEQGRANDGETCTGRRTARAHDVGTTTDDAAHGASDLLEESGTGTTATGTPVRQKTHEIA